MSAPATSLRDRGLTQAEVDERIAQGKVNVAVGSASRTVSQIVRANVFTRFNALLGTMLAVIVVVGPLQDALFGGVLIANTAIGIFQELRAKRTLDRLAVLTAPKARVRRSAKVSEIAVGSVVLDDVLELEPGDQVVVDGRVLEAEGLEVDESLVSGEADPVVKQPGDPVLSGSFVAAGAGAFRATGVGSEAYAARIAQDAKRFTLVRSELRAGVDTILRLVTYAIVPTAILLFFSQVERSGASLHAALRGTVAGVVAMVPEGLVLLLSIAFAAGVVRLARRRVLVQELPAVEVLARVDVLCVDKTGTLTEGKLAVEQIERLASDDPSEALAAFAGADAHPNATMLAIAEAFPRLPHGWDATDSVPFSSARKWSSVSFAGRGSWVIGAPEVVLADPSGLERSVAEHAAEGRRVVLLARSASAPTAERLPDDLVAAALVILGDRPRNDAAATIAYFREQGVALKVISGDDPRTVGAIATRLGVDGADDPIDARSLSDDPGELIEPMQTHSIFGRVSPQQKRTMVRALQQSGHIVGMTGDGVNDALALKDADLGIAMGSGSGATRAVAQLVLLDSTFDALPSVVAEGRRVLGNIERTSNLYVTKTMYAMLIALATGVFGLVFPFLPRHLTLVGAITIGIPSFFLALAPNTDRVRPGFLRRVLRFSVPAGALAALATFLGYRLALHEPGVTLTEAQTTATMVLTWVGLLVLSIVASPLSRWKLAMIWSLAAAFILALLVPFTKTFFALQAPPPLVWLAAFGIAAIVWSFARLLVPHPSGSSGVPLMD
jgi:cation-transporting P-type ATPase E